LSVDVTFIRYMEKSSTSISITVQISAVLAVMPSCSGENLQQHVNITTLVTTNSWEQQKHNACTVQSDNRTCVSVC